MPKVSYFPGVTSSPLHSWLPKSIGRRLRTGFQMFGQVMKGYLTGDAVVLGVESRTSSPVRIPETVKNFIISGLPVFTHAGKVPAMPVELYHQQSTE